MADGSSERLSGPDNAWRRMGDRTNLMVITGVVMFDDPVGYDDLVEKFEERLLPFDRFRQRVVGRDGAGQPRWELDPRFDVEAHVHHVALPEPQDTETFQSFVGDLMSRPVDDAKPLWQAYLVDGAGEGNAVVVRIHHGIADGFALLYVLLGLADDPSQIEFPVGGMPALPDHVRSAGVDADDIEGAAGPTGDGEVPEARHRDGRDAAERSLLEAVGRTVSMAKSAYRALTLDPEPDTPLVGELGVSKRVAWTDPISVDRLKRAGRAHDATINDVLLVATAGALRRHLAERGETVEDFTVRCAIPVNLKPIDERTEGLGNHFGLGFVELPVDEPSVERRLQRITDNTGRLKQGTEAYLMYLLLRIFGRGPPSLQKLILRLFREKATAVVTNVPGPTQPFELCGQEVNDIMVWVPQSNGVGLGVSILSYDGAVRVGVASDAGLLPEPFDLAEAFETEVDAVTAALETTPEA